MKSNNVIKYVDPSIATPGDGSTPATALGDLPVMASLENNTSYVIRRTPMSVSCIRPYGDRTDIGCIEFIGMPKPDDPEYQFMPIEAQTAWGADASDYARIKSTVNTRQQYSNLSHFYAHRINYFRANGLTSSGKSAQMIYINDNMYQGHVGFKKCKFSHEEGDIQDAITQLAQDRRGNYVIVGRIMTGCLEDCWIEHGQNDGNHSIHFLECYYMSINNNQVWMIPSQYDSCAIGMSGSTSYWCKHITATNNDCKIRMNGTAGQGGDLPGFIKIYSADFMRVEGLTASFATDIVERTADFRSTRDFVRISGDRSYSLYVSDVNLQLNKLWKIDSDSKYGILFIDVSHSTSLFHRKCFVKNITVQLAEENGVGTYDTHGKLQDTAKYYAVYIHGEPTSYGNPLKVDNVVVNHPRGSALYLYNCNADNIWVKGGLKTNSSVAHINRVESWYPSYFIATVGGDVTFIDEVVGNKNCPDVPYDKSPVLTHTLGTDYSIYVDKCNVPLSNTEVFSNATKGNDRNRIVCNNMLYDEDDPDSYGNFFQKTYNQLITTWGASRNNGGVVLKFEHKVYGASQSYMHVGEIPNRGWEIMPTTTGKGLLKLYVGLKNHENIDSVERNFVVIASTEDSNGFLQEHYSSLEGKWVLDEVSEWSEPGLVSYCICVPINIEDSTKPVQMRLMCNAYSPDGYIYADVANTEIEMIGS